MFRCMDGTKENKEILKKEWVCAKRLGEIRLGQDLLFHRHFILKRYFHFNEIERIYLRIESGEYGEFPVHEYILVLITIQQRKIFLRMEREDEARKVLELLQLSHPNILQGKK